MTKRRRKNKCTHLHTRTLFAHCRTINLQTDAIIFKQLFRQPVNTHFNAIQSIYRLVHAIIKKKSYTPSAPIRPLILSSRQVNSERDLWIVKRWRFRQPADRELVAMRYSYFGEFAWNRSGIDHGTHNSGSNIVHGRKQTRNRSARRI